MTAPDRAPARFSVRAALGLWLVVLRQRPAAFASIALAATVLQTLLMVSQAYFMSAMGEAVLPSQGELASLSPAYLQASALSTLVTLAAVVIWVALEAVWLRLFVAEARPWAISWGQFGRLFGAFLIVTALFIVAYILLVIVAVVIGLVAFAIGRVSLETLGSVEIVVGVVAAYALSIVVIGLVMVRLSALPALAIMHRSLDFAAAWRATRGAFWRACAGWGVIYLLYAFLLTALAFAGRAWPGLIRAYWDMFSLIYPPRFEEGVLVDPNTAFAGLFESSASIAWVWFDSLLVALIAAIFAVMARGIGVTLAWRVAVPAAAPAPAPEA